MKISEIINELSELKEYIGDQDALDKIKHLVEND